MTWREYHELTKHSAASLRSAPYGLDWANMPDPFRHYEGAPLLDLPAGAPAPLIPTLDVLHGRSGVSLTQDGPALLSQLLFYSAAISASKRVPSTGYKYALRVNPSSGNLHPTEFHFVTRGLKDWPDGLYHYRPSSHVAEQRALGDFNVKLTSGGATVIFILTSIAWREAWKYGARAYRYCLHDIGHAWQALALAGRAMGYESSATGDFADDEAARICGLSGDEWPMLMVELHVPASGPNPVETVWFGGQPNQLSDETIDYPLIHNIHAVTKAASCNRPTEPAPTGSGEIKLPPPAWTDRAFGEVVRARRSALDFQGGPAAMSLAQLSAMLATTEFGAARLIQLYLYAHRVTGLAPGIYRHWPERAELELIKRGDQRVAAAGLSLGQDLAGNACVAFSMIADLDRAARAHGDRGFRYAHFEAGAIGHRLYLAAEALGFGATGIGAFFDNEVHRYLDLISGPGQVVYHFAIGRPVPDPRLEA